MVKQKKKVPGRPKKTFVSKKPKTKIKSGPGRPRKDRGAVHHQVPADVVGFVAKSVDDSKKKDLVILVLFLFSFILFVISLYFTFMKDKKLTGESKQDVSILANIDTGNIDYTTSTEQIADPEAFENTVSQTENSQKSLQQLSPEQQLIVDFYQAMNAVDMTTIYTLTDARLEESNVFKTYYSRRRLTNFSEAIVTPKIVVTNIQEVQTTSTNPDIKSFEYTLEYMLASNQQKYTEERSTTLIKKGDNRRVGKLMCETKGCSTMPFFNTEKYTK